MSLALISSKIQSQADLVSIVSKYLPLKENRRILKGSCPFHPDNSDSLMISPAKNIFKCFGCGKEGGPIEFIMGIENKSYNDVVEIMALEMGLNQAS